MIFGFKVTLGIIGIGNQFCTIFIVDSNNITLQILLKPEVIVRAHVVYSIPILHTNGATGSVIEVDQQRAAHIFHNDLAAV